MYLKDTLICIISYWDTKPDIFYIWDWLVYELISQVTNSSVLHKKKLIP